MNDILTIIAAVSISVAALIIIYSTIKVRRMKSQFFKEKKNIEAYIEKNLTKYLSDNEDLELKQAINAQLINDTHYLMRATLHDLTSPMRFIDSVGTDLVTNWNELDDNHKLDVVNTLIFTGKQIKYLGDEFISTLQFSIIKNKQIDEYSISIASIVLKISPMYKWLFEVRGIAFKVDIDKTIQSFCNPEMAAMLVRNLLEFIVQYTQAKSIKISTKKDQMGRDILLISALDADTSHMLIDDFSKVETLKNERPLFHAISLSMDVAKAEIQLIKNNEKSFDISIRLPQDALIPALN